MGTPLGFLLLDLDHFARMNAEYGQEAGDKILIELAGRIRRYMRSYDLIGRCGGDEFLIALPGCNSDHALQLASRIRTMVLRPPFSVGREMISLTASIGLAQSRVVRLLLFFVKPNGLSPMPSAKAAIASANSPRR